MYPPPPTKDLDTCINFLIRGNLRTKVCMSIHMDLSYKPAKFHRELTRISDGRSLAKIDIFDFYYKALQNFFNTVILYINL